MSEQKIIAQLLFKNLEGSLSEPERLKLESWISKDPANRELFDEVSNEDSLRLMIAEGYREQELHIKQLVWTNIQNRTKAVNEAKVISLYRKRITRLAVAASILFVIGLGSYFLFFNKRVDQPIVAAENHDVQAPDKNRAQIKLADGTIIYLDSAGNGSLASQGGVSVVKTDDGKIAYQATVNGQQSTVQYNTLFNPRGSKVIDMTLCDGSRVWLNAGSSVTYPVAFAGNERQVEVTGEAYFEVTHNAAKPFYVSKGEVSVQVLGTHFNVNAYDDEADITITLLEGFVKVNKGNATELLNPGQQAQVASSIKVVNDADVEQVMAWKNGLFQYRKSDIETILRQAARWYGVEMEYRGKVMDKFSGQISRSVALSQLLKILQETGRVRFEMGDKKVVVIPVS